MVTRIVAGRPVEVDLERIRDAVAGVLPEPLSVHYVVIDGTRYPPKQVLELVTGIDRADFTTHQARRVLQRAGLSCGRIDRGASRTQPGPSEPGPAAEAAALQPFAGRWVAQRDAEVLVAADNPTDVVRWLNIHGQRGAAVFRVPLRIEDTEGLWVR